MSESIIANELRQLVTGPMARNPEHAVTCNLLWAAAGEIERLRSQLDSEAHGHQTMTAEVERLRLLIDKLPTTEDGVPVIPGEEYWCSWVEHDYDGGLVIEARKCRYVGHTAPHVDYKWEVEDCPWVDWGSPPGFAVYSTRELAEANP